MRLSSTFRILGLAALCLLALLPGRAGAQQTYWAGTDRMPLRAEPSGVAAVLAELPRGVPVRLVQGEGAWLLVQEPGGQKGWAYQGHLLTAPPPPAGADLFAPLPGTLILAEAADTSRSSRSMLPSRSAETAPLFSVLEMPLSRADLDAFLREGGIGEYAQVRPQSTGGPLRLPAQKPVVSGGGEGERLLGLNLAVAAMRRVGKPAFGTKLQAYVNLVGLSVARFAPGNALAYRFVVLESPAPLSFGLPGGFVMLTTGLMKALDNEAQLALVLAHEAAHASLGHAWEAALRAPFFKSGASMSEGGVQSPLFAQMIEETLDRILRRGIDPRQEYEADAAAVQMAYRAGYDPLQLATVIQSAERACAAVADPAQPRWSALHPPLSRRLERIQGLLAQLPMQDALALGSERFRANR